MNTSTIIRMIQEDSNIINDIPGFVKRMNEPNQPIETITKEVIIISQTFTSTAELNGGIASESDVQVALNIMSAEPHLEKTNELSNLLIAAFSSGDKTQMIDALNTVQLAVTNTLTELGV